MTSCDQEEHLGRLIYLTSLSLQNHADKLLKPHGLTLEQFHPLKILALKENNMTQRALCEAVKKTPANMTRILDRLAIKQLIERKENPNDRRAFLVSLTAKGRSLVSKVLTIFDGYSACIFGDITASEEQACRKTISKILANLEQLHITP